MRGAREGAVPGLLRRGRWPTTWSSLVEKYRLAQADAETLVPALLAYRELLAETRAERVMVPDASLRAGLLLDIARSEEGRGIEDFGKQVLASAPALGEKYRYDAAHAKNVAHLATRLFDELKRRARPRARATGCSWRWRRCSTTSAST